MAGNPGTTRSWKRALALFVAVYVLINIPATGLYFLVAWLWGTPFSGPETILQDPAYLFTQRLYPLLNLACWMLAAWAYFHPARIRLGLRPAARLGLFWLAIAVPLDFVVYVLLPTPLSLSARDFYVGQFPWIYLTYLALALAPLLWLMLGRRRG